MVSTPDKRTDELSSPGSPLYLLAQACRQLRWHCDFRDRKATVSAPRPEGDISAVEGGTHGPAISNPAAPVSKWSREAAIRITTPKRHLLRQPKHNE